jgi:excisionase family DNA binding protein
VSEDHSVLDIREAAAYLHLKPSYVYQLVSKGRLAYSKPTGGRLLFLRDDLDALVKKARRLPAHESAEQALRDHPQRGRRAS